MRAIRHLTASCASVLAFAASAGAQTLGYYNEPALSGDHLVFSSEGDLWRGSANGGVAVRLTSHEEVETNPVISPDGNWIAFEASYDGPREIYMMPLAGGVPERVTFEGGGVSARGWLGSNKILYRTTNIPGTTPRLLRTVDRESGAVEDIPLADADLATLGNDRETLFVTRYGLSIFSDNAVMYRGGRMAQLWKYTLGSNAEATRLLTNFGAPIRHPMFWQGRVYFVSDKSGADNIWSVDVSGTDVRQHTTRDRWQINAPSLDNGRIVYQSGADIYKYEIASNSTAQLTISLVSDSDYNRTRWIDDPLSYLEDGEMSPNGEAVTVTARGHITVAFPGKRRRVDLRIPDGARARSAVFGSDNETVYAILDKDKSGEIWKFSADGKGNAQQLTRNTDTYIWGVWASPQDETLVYSDKKGRLYHYDLDRKQSTLIEETASSNDDAFSHVNWSSGGRYIAYRYYDERSVSRIAIYDTKTRTKTSLSTGKYESSAPTLSEDGDWLYFISDRHFSPSPSGPWGDRNMGPAFDERTELYAIPLRDDAKFPFKPEDELSRKASDEDADSDDKKDDKSSDKKDESEADIAPDMTALRKISIPPGNYGALRATGKHLFLWEYGDTPKLHRIEITSDGAERKTYASDVRDFALSADNKTLYIQKGNRDGASFYLVNPDRDFPKDTSNSKVRLNDWGLQIDPDTEWPQMALDAWRLHRDFAFDPNLRGVDWESVGDHYLPFADRIGHRYELTDLLGQMSAELGILHSQVITNDAPTDGESGNAGFLGAVYETRANGLEITHIYQGEADLPDTLGPLASPDADLKTGDIITAINHRPIRSQADLTTALTNKAGEQTLVSYRRGRDDLQALVTPINSRSESMMRYRDWVETNREKVATATNGEIGYLHLRAMGGNDVASFARDFFEHVDKDGLIIDVRGNRGGNIDSWIIGTLLREAWAFWTSPHGGPAYPNMQQTFRGHLAILINEGTYSDGETFAAGVKALDIAPLIGTRTAGAGIWLSDRNSLIDRGRARVAEFPQYRLDGSWMLEGLGTSPDIEVNTAPLAAYNGQDLQMDRAIAYLQEQIRVSPIPELSPKPIPELGTTGVDVE